MMFICVAVRLYIITVFTQNTCTILPPTNVYMDVSSAGKNTRWHKTIIVTVQDNS